MTMHAGVNPLSTAGAVVLISRDFRTRCGAPLPAVCVVVYDWQHLRECGVKCGACCLQALILGGLGKEL